MFPLSCYDVDNFFCLPFDIDVESKHFFIFYIFRSATLSGGPEIYGRSSFDYFFSGGADNKQYNEIDTGGDEEIIVPETQSDWQLFDRVRSQDIRLLRSFQVHTIVDLMVEKKKVKFGVK